MREERRDLETRERVRGYMRKQRQKSRDRGKVRNSLIGEEKQRRKTEKICHYYQTICH